VAAVDSPADLDVRDGSAARGLDQRLARLAAGHPSAPGYLDRRPLASQTADRAAGEADLVRPLTDAEHAEHISEVEVRLEEVRAAGLSTDVQHTLDGLGEVWAKQRREVHDAIVNGLYELSAGVPCDGRAILAGGLPGSGKTTVLREFAGLDLSQYLMINPDTIKAEMARRGLMPAVDGLSPMEASELAHEESSHIAKRLANRAQADGRNVIWDITMSKTASTAGRVDSLRAAGYARVEGIFVDIPVEVSVRRADARHREEHDEFRAGHGLGGRYIAESTILNNADASWGSGNRRNFEELKSRFDGWSRYDNSVDGGDPVLVESHAAPGPDEERR
jgi:predicted kinase